MHLCIHMSVRRRKGLFHIIYKYSYFVYIYNILNILYIILFFSIYTYILYIYRYIYIYLYICVFITITYKHFTFTSLSLFMVLYFLVIRISLLLCCTMPCHNFALYLLPFFVFFDPPRSVGYDDKKKSWRSGTKMKRGSSSSGYDRAISRSKRRVRASPKEESDKSQKREEICKRAFCAFDSTLPGKSSSRFRQRGFAAKAISG